MKPDEIVKFKEEWLMNQNANIYEGGDYFTLFAESDAMINSSISFISEISMHRKADAVFK